MNCDELLPHYLLYASGKMEEPELSEMRSHLARGCQDCTAGVRAARAIAFSMGSTQDGQQPSAQLRDRVLSIAESDWETGPRLVKTAKPATVRPAPEPVVMAERQPVPKQRPMFWVRPMPVWLGAAVAAACLVVALMPGLAWRQELSNANAARSESATLLADEQRSAAALRDQVASLQHTSSNQVARAQAVPIFPLEIVRGVASSDDLIQKLSIPHGASALVLALPVDLMQRASSAEIRNASGKAILNVPSLSGNGAESVGLTIPADLLSAGRYTVVLSSGEQNIARIPFRVEK